MCFKEGPMSGFAFALPQEHKSTPPFCKRASVALLLSSSLLHLAIIYSPSSCLHLFLFISYVTYTLLEYLLLKFHLWTSQRGDASMYLFRPECDVPVPRIPGTGNFSFFWVVLEKFGTGKKSRNRYKEKFGTSKKSRNLYQNNLVPEKVLEQVSKMKPWFSLPKFRTQKIYDEYRYLPVTRISLIFGGIGKICYWKKVSELASVKIGIRKKSRNQYRQKKITKKGTGIGIGNIWHR